MTRQYTNHLTDSSTDQKGIVLFDQTKQLIAVSLKPTIYLEMSSRQRKMET